MTFINFFKLLKSLNRIHYDFYRVFKIRNLIHHDFHRLCNLMKLIKSYDLIHPPKFLCVFLLEIVYFYILYLDFK